MWHCPGCCSSIVNDRRVDSSECTWPSKTDTEAGYSWHFFAFQPSTSTNTQAMNPHVQLLFKVCVKLWPVILISTVTASREATSSTFSVYLKFSWEACPQIHPILAWYIYQHHFVYFSPLTRNLYFKNPAYEDTLVTQAQLSATGPYRCVTSLPPQESFPRATHTTIDAVNKHVPSQTATQDGQTYDLPYRGKLCKLYTHM